jgi:hypothetical protein
MTINHKSQLARCARDKICLFVAGCKGKTLISSTRTPGSLYTTLRRKQLPEITSIDDFMVYEEANAARIMQEVADQFDGSKNVRLMGALIDADFESVESAVNLIK